MKEELIAVMKMIRDERMNLLGEEDEERAIRLDKAMSQIHTKLNELVKNITVT